MTGRGTCWVEELQPVVVYLQRRVGVDSRKANDMISVVVELHEWISYDVVRQSDVVHDKHAPVHLHAGAHTYSLALLRNWYGKLHTSPVVWAVASLGGGRTAPGDSDTRLKLFLWLNLERTMGKRRGKMMGW